MRLENKTLPGLGLLMGLVIGLMAGWMTLGWAQPLAERELIGGAAGRPAHMPGELLVKFRPHVSHEQLATLNTTQNAIILRHYQTLDIYRIEVQGDVLQMAGAYHSSPMVEWAQPNRILYPSLEPNDPLYQNFEGTLTDLQKWYFGVENLNAEEAWDIITGRSDVVVAIINTGIGLNHPDLADNIWVNPAEIPGNDIDDDNNGFVDDINGYDFCSGPFDLQQLCSGMDNDPSLEPGDGIDNDGNDFADDNVSHGTLVAGAVGAIGNNDVFGAGAAHQVQLMALKVFVDDGGARTDTILAAIDYAVENGADVINMSLGGPPGEDCPTSDRAFESAINTAFEQNIVVVAAAGNDNAQGPSSPASCTHAIAVAASGTGITAFSGPGFPGEIDERARFTNFGRRPGQSFGVDVAAPGVRLAGPSVCSQADVNSLVDGCEAPGDPIAEVASGTSFSSPLVAGLAALVISRARDLDQEISAERVRMIIQDTTQDLPDDPDDTPDAGADWDGQGRVDFLNAVRGVEGIDPPDEDGVGCNIEMSQDAYVNGDEVTAMEVRITNTGPELVPIQVKIWQVSPDMPAMPPEVPIDFSGLPSDLPPEYDQDFGPHTFFQVTEDTPRGRYEINCRLIDRVTGETLVTDINPFRIGNSFGDN
ncbi:S8 family serine peptidase [Candidatus Entotheonella palauensis]|uniref:S8 family serine peptidase n=1 Tax=Candidatus Entotheonella palauensis TaxID=93172 RepID=UPI000B80054D|nr:S8 family serine peptidase [Candidatus Entotheonella palauensis]